MIDIIKLVLITLYIYFVGYCIINTILIKLKDKMSIYSFIGLSGIIGIGAIGFELFLLYLIKIPWKTEILFIPWLAMFVWFLITKRTGLRIVKPTTREFIITLLIVLLTLVLIGWVLTNPANGFDGWAIWSFKAKVFFLQKSISLDFLKDPTYIFNHSNYVILLPLIQTWIYLHLGYIQTSYAQVIYIIIYASMLLVTLDFLNSITKNKVIPIVLMLILALTPWLIENSQINYADIMLAAYTVSGFVYMIRWFEGENDYYFWLSSLLFGFGAFTKNEGVVVYVVYVVFVYFHLLYSQKKSFFSIVRQTFIPIGISSFAWFCWTLFSKFHQLTNPMPLTNLTINFTLANYHARLFLIFKSIINETIVRYNHWGLTWPIFIFLFIVAIFARIETVKYYLFIFLIMASYIVIYFYTPINLRSQLNTSLDRLVLQVVPAAVLLSGYSLLKLWDKTKNEGQK